MRRRPNKDWSALNGHIKSKCYDGCDVTHIPEMSTLLSVIVWYHNLISFMHSYSWGTKPSLWCWDRAIILRADPVRLGGCHMPLNFRTFQLPELYERLRNYSQIKIYRNLGHLKEYVWVYKRLTLREGPALAQARTVICLFPIHIKIKTKERPLLCFFAGFITMYSVTVLRATKQKNIGRYLWSDIIQITGQ